MAIGPISRTRHDVPETDRRWRPGPTSHEESGIDVADYVQALEQAHLLVLHGLRRHAHSRRRAGCTSRGTQVPRDPRPGEV